MNEYILKNLKENFRITWYGLTNQQKKDVAEYLLTSIDYLIESNKKNMECVKQNLKNIKEICGSEKVFNNIVYYCEDKIQEDTKIFATKEYHTEQLRKISSGEYLASTKKVLFNTINNMLHSNKNVTEFCNKLVEGVYKQKDRLAIVKVTEYLLTIKYIDEESLCQQYKLQIQNIFKDELSYTNPEYMA